MVGRAPSGISDFCDFGKTNADLRDTNYVHVTLSLDHSFLTSSRLVRMHHWLCQYSFVEIASRNHQSTDTRVSLEAQTTSGDPTRSHMPWVPPYAHRIAPNLSSYGQLWISHHCKAIRIRMVTLPTDGDPVPVPRELPGYIPCPPVTYFVRSRTSVNELLSLLDSQSQIYFVHSILS